MSSIDYITQKFGERNNLTLSEEPAVARQGV